jgi:hypothetical protein
VLKRARRTRTGYFRVRGAPAAITRPAQRGRWDAFDVDTKETIATIRAALNEVQKNGQELVSVPALLEYLSNIEARAP